MALGSGAAHARQKHRRGRTPVRLGAAAAALLVVGLTAAQLAGPPSDPPATTTADTILVQRIAAATEQATGDSVVHVVDEQVAQDGTPQTVELWIDETSRASRFLRRDEQGRPVLDVGPLTGPTTESTSHAGQRVVDHCGRRYVEHADTGEASLDVADGGLRTVRELAATGELVEDGTEVVDGRTLTRVTGGSGVLLVDPDTYRPLAARGSFADGSTGGTYEQTYTYLPRTAANLDLLHPPVPDGFTQVDPSAGDVQLGACEGP